MSKAKAYLSSLLKVQILDLDLTVSSQSHLVRDIGDTCMGFVVDPTNTSGSGRCLINEMPEMVALLTLSAQRGATGSIVVEYPTLETAGRGGPAWPRTATFNLRFMRGNETAELLRLLSEDLEDPGPVRREGGHYTDRRVVRKRMDGTILLVDPVTRTAYDPSTGEPLGPFSILSETVL